MESNLKFKDSVIIASNELYIYLIHGKIKIELQKNDENHEAISLYLRGTNLNELQKKIDYETAENLHRNFLENNFLIKTWNNEYTGTIFENQLHYIEQFTDQPNKIQNNISKKTVCIIGLGGVGSIVLQHLVSAGIQNFILIDYDKVDTSNLNRQFIYSTASINKEKTEEAKKYIKKMNSNCKTITFPKMIKTSKDLEILNDFEVDILINAADYPRNILFNSYEYANERGIPWISAGVGLNGGFWGPLLTKNSINIRDIQLNTDLTVKPMKASYGPVNTIISTLLANDVMQYLMNNEPKSLEKRIFIDIKSMIIKEKSFSGGEMIERKNQKK